jgi:tetratricopeptide (TPR) repeat protein
MGDRRNEGATLGDLGLAYAELDENERAIDCYAGALDIARELAAAVPVGSPEWRTARRDEAAHSGNLAVVYANLGYTKQARAAARQALAIFEEIESPYAERARQLLAQLE